MPSIEARSAHDDGSAVSHDLGGARRDVRRRETNVDDRIGTGFARLRGHAVDGLAARLVEQFRIALELAADDVLETREDILAGVLAAHCRALDETQVTSDGLAG